MKLENRIGVGIVGTGVIASEHARTLLCLREKAVLVAAADLNPARLLRFGEAHFFPFAYASASDLIARKDVDLVVVATPPSMHLEIVRESLEAGKYVVCEKPIAHSLNSAREIIELSKHFPGRLSISHQLRFSLEWQRFHWLLTHSDIGMIQRVVCRRVTPISPSVVRGWWGRWNVAGGGAVMTQFIHQLDLLCLLLGQPTWVEANASSSIPGLESEDTCDMKIGFPHDVTVEAFCSVADGPIENEFRVEGEFGSIVYPWKLSLNPDKAALCAEAERRFPTTRSASPIANLATRALRKGLRQVALGHLYPQPASETSHLPYMRAVFAAIKAKAHLPVAPESVWQSLELTTAIYCAAIKRVRQQLPCEPWSYQGLGELWHARTLACSSELK